MTGARGARQNPPPSAVEGACGTGGRGARTALYGARSPLSRPLLTQGPPSPAEEGGFWRAVVFAFLLSVAPIHAHALQPNEVLKDPALEARARHISEGLRCLVCQNQSIDDSDAPLAKDLRVIVRERLTAGDSNPQVIDYVVGRYGEFVLLRPVFAWHTLVLWLTPLLVVGLGAFSIWRLSRRKTPAAPHGLSETETAEVEALLSQREAKPTSAAGPGGST